MVHAAAAITTHAIAPDVVNLGCLPRGGTTSEVLLGLRVEFPPHAFVNFQVQSALQAVEYALHFVADPNPLESSDLAVVQQQVESTPTGVLHFSFPVHETNTVHVVAATDTTVDLHANLTDLVAGTNYSVTVAVQTQGSGGIFGRHLTIHGCVTHHPAPAISAVTIHAKPKSTTAVELAVELPALADVHYVLGLPDDVRRLSRQSSSLATLEQNGTFRMGTMTLSPDANVTSTTVHELEPGTTYAVLVYAETSNSFGVLGPAFAPTEVRTHDEPGTISVVAAAPVAGSTSALEVVVNMTRPQDHTVLCIRNRPVNSSDDQVSDVFTCTTYNDTRSIVVHNLTRNQPYELYVLAETAEGVVGAKSDVVVVTTHDEAPEDDLVVQIGRINGCVDRLDAVIASRVPCWVHYVLVPVTDVEAFDASNATNDVIQSFLLQHPKKQTALLDGLHVMNRSLEAVQPNTSYVMAAVFESISQTTLSTRGSQVFGAVHRANTSTFALAPLLLQSAVLPLNASVDTIRFAVNISTPGRVHFMITDADLQDPNLLANPTQVPPFVQRGAFDVADLVFETANETIDGVNVSVTKPVPNLVSNTFLVTNLVADTLYHVFLATETSDSGGVFGTALPAPHLVKTHAPPPQFLILYVAPSDATSLVVNVTLSRFGIVHYLLLFRGPDSVVNHTVSSVRDLTPDQIKRASWTELGDGVPHNGSLVVEKANATKRFSDLVSNATYELCLVAETDASDGVFGDVFCRVVHTFDDANTSHALDVVATPGTTDQLTISWTLRQTDHATRVPYFVVVEEAYRHHALKSIELPLPRVGEQGVVASGLLPLLQTYAPTTATNSTKTHDYHIVVRGLDAHTKYTCLLAAEVHASNGLFTDVHTVAVTTHAHPPKLVGYVARPAPGNTTGLEVVLDVACANCHFAILHVAVTKPQCHLSVPFHLADACTLVYGSRNVSIPAASQAHNVVRGQIVFLNDSVLLTPNTLYDVHVTTETGVQSGVLSPVKVIQATTHPTPPTIAHLTLTPKHASTTELELEIQLTAPGIVHYIIGEDSKHIEVVSAHNISGKKTLWGQEDWHKYPPQTIVYRRSVSVVDAQIETLQYLTANTSYSVWVVVETLDGGLYGPLVLKANVSTFGPAPRLLAHEAAPMPASTTHLRLGYTLSTPGTLHCVVATSHLWRPTFPSLAKQHNNRINYDTAIVAQVTLADQVTGFFDIAVPYADTNYTVVLVTETTGSHGIYGAVAQLEHIHSSSVAPDIVDVHAVATDARMDALTVSVTLTRPGIVHYASWESQNQNQTQVSFQTAMSNGSQCEFVVDGLLPATWYDLYLETETYGSEGVMGPQVKVPQAAITHGPPPHVLEDVDCSAAPDCEGLGREPVHIYRYIYIICCL